MTILSNIHLRNARWYYTIINVNVRLRTITRRTYVATSHLTPNRNKLARTLIYNLETRDLAHKFSRRHYRYIEDFIRDIRTYSDSITIFDDIKTSYYDN